MRILEKSVRNGAQKCSKTAACKIKQNKCKIKQNNEKLWRLLDHICYNIRAWLSEVYLFMCVRACGEIEGVNLG